MNQTFEYPPNYQSQSNENKKLIADLHDYFRSIHDPSWENKEDRFSPLYFIERDTDSLMNKLGAEIWLFPSALCLFSGIDVLARIETGDLREEGNKSRFIQFIEKTQCISLDEIEPFYNFRCSIVHSYHLHSSKNQNSLMLIHEKGDNVFWVDSEGLHLAIVNFFNFFKSQKGIIKYRILESIFSDNSESRRLKDNFIKIEENLGWLKVQT